MRIVFMGTPDFAVPCLCEISKKHEVVGVFTQPDRPKGRGYKLVAPPVKDFALEHGFQVFQPEKLKDEESIKIIEKLKPDAIVVVAYGQLLSKSILEIPRYGCINVHGSILPKFRGASPIQWSIVKGEKETGVTTMLMNEGLDTGDILEIEKVEITSRTNAQILHDKLSDIGSKLIISTLDKLESGKLKAVSQIEVESSYAPLLKKEMGKIDWNSSAISIDCLVRGFNPWPVAHTTFNGEGIKIFDCEVDNMEDCQDVVPGTVVSISQDSFSVTTGQGVLKITEVQLSGKKRMPVRAFLLGNKIELNGKLI